MITLILNQLEAARRHRDRRDVNRRLGLTAITLESQQALMIARWEQLELLKPTSGSG
jgi:transposase